MKLVLSQLADSSDFIRNCYISASVTENTSASMYYSNTSAKLYFKDASARVQRCERDRKHNEKTKQRVGQAIFLLKVITEVTQPSNNTPRDSKGVSTINQQKQTDRSSAWRLDMFENAISGRLSQEGVCTETGRAPRRRTEQGRLKRARRLSRMIVRLF